MAKNLASVLSTVFVIVLLTSLCAEISNISSMKTIRTDQVVYSIIMWTLGSLGFMMNMLVVYLVVEKSTTEIKEYKLYLLNFSITDIFFTILLSWTFQPGIIIPGGGCFIVGSLRRLGGLSGHIQVS